VLNQQQLAIIETILQHHTGSKGTIASTEQVGGGSINDAQVITLSDGQNYFLKTNSNPKSRFFECEADGLLALAATNIVRVPHVIATAPKDTPPFILMEYIESGAPSKNFHSRFGQKLAQLHKETTELQYGFDQDNYIGLTEQHNTWSKNWVDFFREHRLEFQLRRARDAQLANEEMMSLGESLLSRLDLFLADPDEPPTLIHGDLWGGNYLVDRKGEPVLVDPAVYYGRREAELAMTELFGGFEPAFYHGYNEVWPLAPEAKERIELYKLYHLLNHLNLFGASYRDGCMNILRRFA